MGCTIAAESIQKIQFPVITDSERYSWSLADASDEISTHQFRAGGLPRPIREAEQVVPLALPQSKQEHPQGRLAPDIDQPKRLQWDMSDQEDYSSEPSSVADAEACRLLDKEDLLRRVRSVLSPNCLQGRVA